MDSFGTGGIMDFIPANSKPAINPINKFFDLATNSSNLLGARLNFKMDTSEIYAQLMQILAKIESKIEEQGETAVNRLQELINPPAAFAEKTFNELLTIIKECILLVPTILTEIKGELATLTDKVRGFVRQAFEALKAEIYVPVLSSIYKGIFGTPMTVIGMISLLAAIPLSFAGIAFTESIPLKTGCIVAAVMSCVSAIWAILLEGVHNMPDETRIVPGAFYFGFTVASMIVLAQTDGVKTDEVAIRIVYAIFGLVGIIASFTIENATQKGCRLIIGGVELVGGAIVCIMSAIEVFAHQNERFLLGGMLADSGRFVCCGGARVVNKLRIPVLIGVNVGLGGTAAGLYGHEAHIHS
jgi:uncharacterized membrane protein